MAKPRSSQRQPAARRAAARPGPEHPSQERPTQERGAEIAPPESGRPGSGDAQLSEGRGRQAARPSQIPARGWRDIALRVWGEIGRDNIALIAAGVAFYSMLAIFPAIAALISIYGLVADPTVVQNQITAMREVMPEQGFEIIEQQLVRLASAPPSGLSLGLVVGLSIALWSTMSGVKGFITALNVAYEEGEKRGFFALNALAFALTLGAILFIILALSMVVVLPAVLGFIGLGGWADTLIRLARWPVLALMVMAGLAVLYRYGPSREQAQWRWVSWGAVIATVLWLVGSIVFSWYVSNLADYNATYGSVGAVVILLMWLYLSAFAVLLGAEINSEMEHQTGEDTTTGRPEPIGDRRALMADTIGPKP